MSRVSMNYNNSIAQVTPVCYCYLCVSIVYTPRSKWNKNTNLTTDDHIFWTTWFTWWDGVFFKYGSKTVLIHSCLPQIAAEMKYFVNLQSFTKNSWSQFTLQEMISRNIQRKRPQFHEKNRKIPWKQWYWFWRFV